MPAAVPELIDIETLARQLGDSVRHVRRLVAERRIPYLKVGHFVRFDPDEIVAWLDAQASRCPRPFRRCAGRQQRAAEGPTSARARLTRQVAHRASPR
jgi:excisionase family DNA binding protein